MEREPLRLAQDEITTRAQEAVTFARDNAVEREAVADMRQVMTDALRRNLGRTTYEAVTTELRRRQERGEFIDIMRDQRSPETTTQRMLADGTGKHTDRDERKGIFSRGRARFARQGCCC